MGKLKLQPDPTFRAKVAIAVAGGDDMDVEFTFRHRDKEELLKFIEFAGAPDRKGEEVILECVVGWEFDEAFTPDNVAVLVAKRLTAAKSVYEKYIDELTKARAKN